jgi:hypothetical protein
VRENANKHWAGKMRKIRENEKLALMTEKFLYNNRKLLIQDISRYFSQTSQFQQ